MGTQARAASFAKWAVSLLLVGLSMQGSLEAQICPCGSPCGQLIENQNLQAQSVQACDTLLLRDVHILNPGLVTLTAGGSVKLGNGFVVEDGAELHLAIDPSLSTTNDQVAGALGLAAGTVQGFEFTTNSGADPCTGLASIEIGPAGVLLSTGHAADGGTGSTDFLADGIADVTEFSLTLAVPSGMNSLVYSSLFNTAEYGGAMPKADQAEVTFSSGGAPVTLATVETIPQAYPKELRAVDVSSLGSITATFLVEDAVDGFHDSALRLGRFFFTEAEIVTGEQLAGSLGPPGWSNAEVTASSGELRIVDILSAVSDPGSLVITTGFGRDKGLEDTDLGGDSLPDATRFKMTLEVPQDGAKSLVFTTQFRTNEFGASPQGTDDARVESTASGSQGLGSVGSSSGKFDATYTRAIDVEGMPTVTVTFEVADFDDDGRRDSGLRISGFYFSDYPASLLTDPRPSDSQLHTGTYAYSKTLLAASGPMMPFGFMIHYNSGPRRTSYRMGPNWGHSYDWGVIELGNGDALVRRGDGRIESFKKDGNGYSAAHGQVFNSLSQEADGSFVYLTTDQTRYVFSAPSEESGGNPEGRLLSISDPNGNETVLEYAPPSGCLEELTRVTDTRQQTAVFTYDASCRLIGVSYAFQSISLTYDESDNLIAFTDPDQKETTFNYGLRPDLHYLHEGFDATGTRFVTNWYDNLHRVIEQVDANGNSSFTTYDSSTSRRTDRLGNVTTTTFDPLDRTESLKSATGSVWQYGYDDNDNLTSTTDPLNRESRSTYDGRGNVLTELNALEPPGLIRTIYDSKNRPVEAIDEMEKSISFQYDPAGNLVRVTDALSVESAYEYDTRGLRTRSTDRRGKSYEYRSDAVGDLVEVIDPLGGVSSFKYDELGRQIASYDANGNGTFFTFDAAGRVTSTIDALEGTTTQEYDAEGRLVAETNALRETSYFEYSKTGKLVRFENALGISSSSEYDREDRLVATRDPRGNETSFRYDKAGRFLGATDPLGGVVSATYDAVGNRVAVSDPNLNTTTFAYDATGLSVGETDPLGQTVSNTYDARGLVTTINNARGQEIRLGYDAAGRVTAINLSDHDVELVLDANGNRVATIGRDGRRSEREYDALNRLASYKDVHGNTLRYAYDAAGNLLEIIYSDGAVVRYTYDELNRMTRVTDWEGRETHYEYDAAGKLLQAKLPDRSLVRYDWDAAGRLLSIDDTSRHGITTFRTEYTLDSLGLRISEDTVLPLEPPVTSGGRSFEHNVANQITSDAGVAFSYDADGNMTRGVVGRLPVDLVYDELGRLVEVGATRYEYDDEGLRIEATINGKTVRYVQNPNAALPQVLEEHDEHGRIVTRFVYGIGLISSHGRDDDDDSDSDSERVSVYHFDSRGSTVALTNLGGHIKDRYAYDPFGLVVARDGHTPNRYTYNGRDGVIDDGNGLYFMRTRYYEPRLMRYVSRDELALGSLTDTQSLNRYAYARGNPIHGIDPSGAWFGLDDAVMAIGGAVANVAVTFVSDIVSGEWSDPETYAGAAVEGAVYGETLLYTGNPVLAGAAGAAAGNATEQGLKIATGKQESFNLSELGEKTLIGGAIGVFGGGAAKSARALRGFSEGLIKHQSIYLARRGVKATASISKAWLLQAQKSTLSVVGAFKNNLKRKARSIAQGDAKAALFKGTLTGLDKRYDVSGPMKPGQAFGTIGIGAAANLL